MDRIVLEREGLSFPRETTVEHAFVSYSQIIADAQSLRATEGSEFTKSFFKAAYRYISNMFFAPIVLGFAANESYEELSRMNDRELADIGISRADIPRYAFGHATSINNQVSVSAVPGWSPSAAEASNDLDRNLAA